MAKATVAFDCEWDGSKGWDSSADGLRAELTRLLHGTHVQPSGSVRVSIEHDGTPSPENGRRMWYSPRLRAVCVLDYGPDQVETRSANEMLKKVYPADPRCSCKTCGGERS